MSKSTHLSYLSVLAELRNGGVTGKGGQQVLPSPIGANWYPLNPAAATASTPKQSDVNALLDAIAPLVARLTVEYSVGLALSYRFVQSGIAAGSAFSIVLPSGSTITSSAATSWFDQNISVSEAVAVDVVNKNPSLAYDLAVRLAVQAAWQIDKAIFAKHASLTGGSAIGTATVTPTTANFATAVGEMPVTGEPIFGILATATRSAYFAANTPSGSQSYVDHQPVLINVGAARPIRLVSSDQIAVSSGNRNLVILPSAFGFATASLGASLGSAPVIAPSGVQSIRGTVYKDPETAKPQIAMQLVCGNTGSGAQTVYVNILGAPLVLAPANGVVVLS